MQHFRMTLTSKGQVTLPAEYRRLVGARAGDRLTLVVDDEGHGTLTVVADDLSAIHRIVDQARSDRSVSRGQADPVGDLLVEDDERTKSGRR